MQAETPSSQTTGKMLMLMQGWIFLTGVIGPQQVETVAAGLMELQELHLGVYSHGDKL